MTGDISKIRFRMPGFEEDAKKLHFTERQASAILEMRLYKLIGLEILALEKEHKATLARIKEYEKILGSRAHMDAVIRRIWRLSGRSLPFRERPALRMALRRCTWRSRYRFRRLSSSWTGSATASFWTREPMSATGRLWTESRCMWCPV